MTSEQEQIELLPPQQQRGFHELLDNTYRVVPNYLREDDLWTPYIHPPQEYDRLVDIQKALQKGCLAILGAFQDDERLHSLLAPRFGERELEQLTGLEGVPLGPQFIRPDYIYDREGEPRVCEINARFIFNGNIASVHMADYLSQTYDIDTTPYQLMDRFMHRAYDGDGSEGDATVILQASEQQHDLLLQKQRFAEVYWVKPEILKVLDASKVGRLVLELHQHELARVFDDLAQLMRDGVPSHNDPRVINLLHDKRLLVALSDEDYMASLTDEVTAQTLAEGIVPSYHPAWEGREPENIPAKSVMAKGAISGKGDSLHVVRLSTYQDSLPSPKEYVYQPRLLQPKILPPDGEPAEIAGTLPMTLEHEVFGPGIVRILRHHRLKGFKGFTVAVRGRES